MRKFNEAIRSYMAWERERAPEAQADLGLTERLSLGWYFCNEHGGIAFLPDDREKICVTSVHYREKGCPKWSEWIGSFETFAALKCAGEYVETEMVEPEVAHDLTGDTYTKPVKFVATEAYEVLWK